MRQKVRVNLEFLGNEKRIQGGKERQERKKRKRKNERKRDERE